MGVPKFYRWISERYPCLSEVVKEFQIPEFDALYLDMNGVVHVCSHPEDDNPHFRITEEKIFTDVSHYIEFLFRMIKPRRCFFMAIDGVAPRAKMNQQRGRRFRSAREAEELEKRAKEKGEVLPSEKRFDSNCITPGTPFMARLQDYLKYFVAQKISSDPLWQNVKVILSGHETPGEGEHKIMDYIRYQKSGADYDPNTRHCLYGLDADLMMLGLVSHEPHFCLLREEVRFAGRKDKNKRPATPEETTFHLLHLSLMREYINHEFSPLQDPGKLSFEYNLERVIDDWVLMGFLVGNDFIPHLPQLHIHHDGLPLLWKTYIDILPQLDGYLNDGGYLNLQRFEKFMAELSKYDVETFRDQFSDLKWLEGKTGEAGHKREKKRKGHKKTNNEPRGSYQTGGGNQFGVLINLEDNEEELSPHGQAKLLNTGHSDLIDLRSNTPDTEDGDTFESEFRMHKDNYYMTKMNYPCATREVLREQATEYVRAIQWILLYYFEGVPSWSWFYPHHYAPYMSDVKDFSDFTITFDLSIPFLPFQQLMAVLPAASKEILPTPYRTLMTNEESPIVDFYPVDFTTDLNGKLQEWEAVVLIPFIDEKRLLSAMEPINAVLTDEEKARNRHGPHRLFQFNKDVTEEYSSPFPELFPDIPVCRVRCSEIPMFEFRIPSKKLFKGLPAGVRQDVYFPGFPTLKHITNKVELKKAGVRVFQMNSRGENMVVKIIHNTEQLSTEEVANDLLGATCFVGWPHLSEAKVVEVSDGEVRYQFDTLTVKKKTTQKPAIICEDMPEGDSMVWGRQASGIKDQYSEKRGIEIGRTSILIHVLPMMGRKYVCTSHGQVTLEKQWAIRPVPYALQATVKDITVFDPSYTQFKNLDELFAPKTSVFMLGFPHYGSQGEVLEADSNTDGRIRVGVTVLQEPDLDRIQGNSKSLSMHYMPGYAIAQRVGISSHLLSRITGTILVARGGQDTQNENDMKVNVGLNLKFNKKNEEVPGFTKKVDTQWLYSVKALEVVSQYVQKFPAVFEFISVQERGTGQDVYFEDKMFEKPGSGSLKEVSEFLKTLSCADIKPTKIGADIVDELVIKEIEKEVERIKAVNKKKRKSVKMHVKPHLLFRPIFLHGGLVPDPSTTYQLFDRVVSVREGFSVPFGLRGTIIGIHQGATDFDTIYEIIFDVEFVGGITLRCTPGRGYRCSSNSLINISHGVRKENAKLNPQSSSSVSVNNSQSSTSWSGKGSNSGLSYSQPSTSWSGKGSNSGLSYSQASVSKPQRTENSYTMLKGGQSNRQFGSGNTNNQAIPPGPQFVTPRVPTYSVGDNTGNTPRQTLTSNRTETKSSEFAAMWKELQGSADVHSPKKNTLSLSEAAQVLDVQYLQQQQQQQNGSHITSTKTVKNETNERYAKLEKDKAESKSASEQSGNMTKIDLQSLFGQASSTANTADIMSNEFSAMMSSLEISAGEINPDGSMVYRKTHSPNMETGNDLKPSTCVTDVRKSPSSPVAPSYGRQVSIQELFAGVTQSTSVEQVDQSHSPQPMESRETFPDYSSRKSPRQQATPVNQTLQQQQPVNLSPRQQGPPPGNPLLGFPHLGIPPTGMPPTSMLQQTMVPPPSVIPSTNIRNPVMKLLEFSKAAGLKPPKYDYVHEQKTQVYAFVTMGTGQKFFGTACRTKEEAAESAASMTLAQMEKFPVVMMGIPHPAGLQHPPWRANSLFSQNSAFSPVLTKQPPMVPGFMGFTHPPPNFPPGLHSRFPPPGYHSNQPHPAVPVSPGNRTSAEREGSAPGAPNPFVPLQVTIKQKSPQKPTSSSTRLPHDRGDDSINQPMKSDQTMTVPKPTPNEQKSQSDTSASGVKKSPPKTESKKVDDSTKKQTKRNRPRLAANFNFPK